MKLIAVILLACSVQGQSVGSRDLTLQEAHAIVEASLPGATRQLPGYELDDFEKNDPPQFYFVEVLWDNPVGSVVWGNFAVDRHTGDLWAGTACSKVTSRRTRSVQKKIRKEIGLNRASYRRIKRAGPMCD